MALNLPVAETRKLVFYNSDLGKSITVNITGMHLIGIHFMGVQLIGVHLTGVHLMGIHFMGMHLIGVYLTGMCLIGVYLTGMHLMSVYLMACTSWGRASQPHFRLGSNCTSRATVLFYTRKRRSDFQHFE